MPDDFAPPTGADALYPHLARGEDGSLGESGLDTARRVQMEGIARPADSIFSQDRPTDSPPSATRTAPPPNARTSALAFDPARYSAPDGQQVDETMLGEFGTAARELGLDQKGGERLLALHQKAVTAEQDAYANRLADGADALRAELNPRDIEAAKELINDPAMTPPELREWFGTWGNHPAVARMLTQWAAAVRYGRR
jgi:hypothetical protein